MRIYSIYLLFTCFFLTPASFAKLRVLDTACSDSIGLKQSEKVITRTDSTAILASDIGFVDSRTKNSDMAAALLDEKNNLVCTVVSASCRDHSCIDGAQFFCKQLIETMTQSQSLNPLETFISLHKSFSEKYTQKRPTIASSLILINETSSAYLSTLLDTVKIEMKFEEIQTSICTPLEQKCKEKPSIITSDLQLPIEDSEKVEDSEKDRFLHVAETGDCRTMVFRPKRETFIFDSEFPPQVKKYIDSIVSRYPAEGKKRCRNAAFHHITQDLLGFNLATQTFHPWIQLEGYLYGLQLIENKFATPLSLQKKKRALNNYFDHPCSPYDQAAKFRLASSGGRIGHLGRKSINRFHINYYHGLQLQKGDIIFLFTNGIGKMFCAEEIRSICFGLSSTENMPDLNIIAARMYAASDLKGKVLSEPSDTDKTIRFRPTMTTNGVADYLSREIDAISTTLDLKRKSLNNYPQAKEAKEVKEAVTSFSEEYGCRRLFLRRNILPNDFVVSGGRNDCRAMIIMKVN